MDRIPQHTALLLERLLAAYSARICPPQARHAVLLGFSVDADRATLHELRPICGVPGTRRPVPLAQFRYDAARHSWRLFVNPLRYRENSDDSVRWRRYAPLPLARSVIELLREVDADRHGLLWDRVDGKSLRWCSSRGRCAGCDAQYCEVLGLGPSRQLDRALAPPAMAR
jgi:hypothetical protein